MDTSEKNFEEAIEQALLAGGPDALDVAKSKVGESRASYATGIGTNLWGESRGFHRHKPEDYNKELCLIPDDVFNFLFATQVKEWKKFEQQYGKEAKDKFLQRLAAEIKTRGTLDVLRKGLKANGCAFKLAYFRPSTGLNPETQQLYEANIFSVTRQLKYSLKNQNSLDMAIFLNGLPIFTAELKNPFKGQTVQNAIQQYRHDRDPREPLFSFGRCLAHFAVDPDQVFVATELTGPQTRFLPFNKGNAGGAGNPPSALDFATAYLWRQIWARDSLLNLLEHFIHVVEVEDEEGRKTGQRRMTFPRYHQLETVRLLVADARMKGPGQRYLIQHSAGSGKSNSIAWLAHQLSVLHDAGNQRVFNSIIVITDRRVLDRQLQQTVRQFQQVLGLVENIDTTSRQLKQALEEGKNIIVTTLQKFPVIVNQVAELPGKRFAVIIDEAHSSQSGESTKSLKAVLSASSLAEAAAEEEGADDKDSLEDRITEEMRKRGPLPNVSTFAFTATPKTKTLELFGTKRSDGKFEPFSLYSMRQAIEEGFILDVLQNYTTYTTYWNLLKKIEDDPRYDRAKATYLLKSFVDLHEHAIAKKVAIMLEHFESQVAHQINGKAKAMIVTRSRLHAVRYKIAVDQYLKSKGQPYKALVAFSGTVKDGGFDYTEANMNGLPETQTAKTFERDEYKLLIVANKFQTGFDQPLLHTMYVDKKLGGVNAVQTLSRLNRIYPSAKTDTMVLDFANAAEEIQKAFEPYYEKTLLSEATDPNLLYDLQTRLSGFHIHDESDIDHFAFIFFDPAATQDKIHATLAPAVSRYQELQPEEQADFRGQLTDYIRLYAFLSQILPFVDTDLEKFYEFARLLLRKLPVQREQLPLEIRQNIDIESYRVQQTGKGRIKLKRGTNELDPIGPKVGYLSTPEELEALSQIIKTLNERFGTDFKQEDYISVVRNVEEKVANNPALKASQKVNSPENLRLTFEQVVNDHLQDIIDINFKFYKLVNDNTDFAKVFMDSLFERYLKRTKAA